MAEAVVWSQILGVRFLAAPFTETSFIVIDC